MHICTPDEMREIEAKVDASGHSYDAMMRMAGAAVAAAVEERVPGGGRVVVLCGPGNNGGDGLVAAADLARAGYDVTAYLWRRDPGDVPAPVDEEALRDVTIVEQSADDGLEELARRLAACDAIVDALLGTGGGRAIESPLSDILAAAAEALAASEAPAFVAVDASTGINLADGSVDPATLPADVTVTFGFPKVGQLRFPGAGYVGELVVDDIGMDDSFASGDLHMATRDEVAALLPERPVDGHKGTFGKALVVAGSVNYTGAAFLASAAAYRTGAGLVTTAVPSSVHAVVAGLLPEATFVVLPEDLGVIGRNADEVVRDAWHGYDVVLIGPGLTRQKSTAAFLVDLLSHAEDEPDGEPGGIGFEAIRSHPAAKAVQAVSGSVERPGRFVIDADGLNLLADAPRGVSLLPPESVLTPHPGEMARLTGRDVREVNEDRTAVALESAAEWGHVVVLKGALTVVAAPDGRATIIPFADSALAVAGTGDVLSGAVTGFLAQGLAPFEAAVAGAYLHGLAGQMAGETVGSRGTVAGDVLRQLPWAVADVEDGTPR